MLVVHIALAGRLALSVNYAPDILETTEMITVRH